MRPLSSLLAFVAGSTLLFGAAAAQHAHAPSAESSEVRLWTGLGAHHHQIATRSPDAQRFFDQGLTLVFGFNHAEAIRFFKKAAELDPAAPMPHWGIAYALGPNINADVDPAAEKAATEAVRRAVALAKNGPPVERDYISALAKRYSDDPKADLKALAQAYKKAMGALVERYPDDLDLATLFAESAMDLNPWKFWSADGKPADGTLEIAATLESVLRRDPTHPGANHYYIHTLEASPHPERALASARTLEALVPQAGHLVHMPAHIYSRVGDHHSASLANRRAADVDRAYLEHTPIQGIYRMMYYPHDLSFLFYSAGMEGRYADSRAAADQSAEYFQPHLADMLKDMPMMESLLAQPYFARLRFRRWDELLALPAPAAPLKVAATMWHFARAVAYAAKKDHAHATVERAAFEKAAAQVPADAGFGCGGFTPVKTVAVLAGHVLDAWFARARHDVEGELRAWKAAVTAQDGFAYDEPPAWFHPTRESLGGALLRAKRWAEAEQVFRADLDALKNPRNPRSLFGLTHSLTQQKRASDAAWTEQELKAAWLHADSRLEVDDL